MLIGRENEIATLHGLMSSDESQFVAVYGRRRVGKTFLIREAYKNHFLTLTMRHPSWIFLFFGGRIVTFAPV